MKSTCVHGNEKIKKNRTSVRDGVQSGEEFGNAVGPMRLKHLKRGRKKQH